MKEGVLLFVVWDVGDAVVILIGSPLEGAQVNFRVLGEAVGTVGTPEDAMPKGDLLGYVEDMPILIVEISVGLPDGEVVRAYLLGFDVNNDGINFEGFALGRTLG